MKKSITISFSILALLSLSLVPSLQLLGVGSVKGLNVAVQYGYLNPFNQEEKNHAEDVCDYIYDLFDGASWGCSNAYWDYSTGTSVGQVIQWENSPYNGVGFATNWWVGDYHGGEGLNPTPSPYGHLYFYGNSGDDVMDAQVYFYNTWWYDPWYGWDRVESKQYFNFIWTCVNGGTYWNDADGNYDDVLGIVHPNPSYSPPPASPPPTIPTNTNDEYGFEDDATGVVGMPLAWTGISDMSLDGYNSYSGDYCYISFESKSPFMKDIPPGFDNAYEEFPKAFYRYALGYVDSYHHNVRESLNYAAQQTFDGTNYLNSILNNGDWYYFGTPQDYWHGWYHWRMRVLGCGYLSLPN